MGREISGHDICRLYRAVEGLCHGESAERLGVALCSTAYSLGMAVFGYKNWVLKLFRFIHLPIFTVASLVLCVQAARGKIPLGIAMFWTVGWIWVAYRMFWRACHTVEVEGNTLRWRSALRSGTVDVTDLTGNRNLFGFVGSMQTLRQRSGRPIIVAVYGRGWLQFLDALNAHHPEHPFRASRLARFSAKWPGAGFGSGFYQR